MHLRTLPPVEGLAGRFAAAGHGRPLFFFGISTDMHRFTIWIVLCVR